MRAFFFLVVFAGCSQVVADDFLPLDASPIPGDATLPDAFPPIANDAANESTIFKGGGPFTCGGCICDGTLYMCWETSGGTANAPLDLDASTDADAADDDADAGPPLCDHDAGEPRCTQIPIACLPKPTCDCVLPSPSGSCSCSIDPSGNGIRIDCVAP